MATTRARGLDISEAQGAKVDFPAIRAAGYDWVTLKATEGHSYVDRDWDRNYKSAKLAGLLVDAYHFMTSGSPVEDQVRHFAREVEGIVDLPPCNDFEAPAPANWRAGDADDLVVRGEAAVAMMEDLLGGAMSYSYPDFLTNITKRVQLSTMPTLIRLSRRALWFAAYPHQKLEPSDLEWPLAPPPWPRPKFWQWSGDGGLAAPGVPSVVDHDLFDGTRDDLLRYLLPKSESFVRGADDPTGPAA